MNNQDNETGTSRKTATKVETIVTQLQMVTDTAMLLGKKYDFFNPEKFKQTGFNKLVTALCKEHGVSEDHIRRVADLPSILELLEKEKEMLEKEKELEKKQSYPQKIGRIKRDSSSIQSEKKTFRKRKVNLK